MAAGWVYFWVSYFLPFLSLIAGAWLSTLRHDIYSIGVVSLLLSFSFRLLMAFWKTTSSPYQHCAVPFTLTRKGNTVHNDHVDEVEDWTKSVPRMTNQI